MVLTNIPVAVSDIDVEKKGSPFTRGYIIEFIASKKQIKDWIEKSKRLKENNPKRKNAVETYDIYPSEEKSFGGNVELKNTNVVITMSWS